MRLSLIPVVAAGLLAAALPATAAPTQGAHVRPTLVAARFQTYQPGARGITYNEQLVPAGSHALVAGLQARGRTTVSLVVHGLKPNHEYGAHVHTKPCGPTGADAGPHHQHVVDPVQPSVDPAYANPENEIWLDFTTGRTGSGFARSRVDWQFTDRRGGSVVIHETHTHTDPGHAGTAGARLACVTVPF